MPWFQTLKNWLTLDRMIALLLIAISAFFYWEAGHYPAGGSYFPHFALVAIILLSALMLIFSFLPKHKRDREETADTEKAKPNLRPFFLMFLK